MFEYAKKFINGKIKEYEGHLDTKNKKMEELQKIKKHIEEYKNLELKKILAKRDLRTTVILYILWAIGASVAWTAGGYAAVAVVLEILCGLSTIAGVIEIRDIINLSKKIKGEYSDLANLTDEEFHKKDLEVDADYEAQEAVICIIENIIENLKEPLNDFEEYLVACHNYENNPFYTADTEEEYKEEMSSRLEGNMLEDYLNEKVDYSKMHFNNKIGDEIDYTLESKTYGRILK